MILVSRDIQFLVYGSWFVLGLVAKVLGVVDKNQKTVKPYPGNNSPQRSPKTVIVSDCGDHHLPLMGLGKPAVLTFLTFIYQLDLSHAIFAPTTDSVNHLPFVFCHISDCELPCFSALRSFLAGTSGRHFSRFLRVKGIKHRKR